MNGSRIFMCISNSLWINDLFHEFTIDTLSFSRFRLFFLLKTPWITIFLVNTLWIYNFFSELTLFSLWTHYLFSLEFTISLRIHFNFVILTIWIYYLCREFTMNKLWTHFSNLMWITYLFFEFIMHSLSFCKILMNSLAVSRIHLEFIIF